MTVAEWYAAADDLRAAGLSALGELYADNARRVGRGEAPVWPIPAPLRVSTRLADKAEGPAFADDARDGGPTDEARP